MAHTKKNIQERQAFTDPPGNWLLTGILVYKAPNIHVNMPCLPILIQFYILQSFKQRASSRLPF